MSIVALVVTVVVGPGSASPAPCDAGWTEVPLDAPGFTPEGLSGTGASDVWLVGYDSGGRRVRAAAYRWDGAAWTSSGGLLDVPSPANLAWDVHAVAADDVWVVGTYQDSAEAAMRAMLVRWNGTEWSQSFVGLTGTVGLLAVDAASSDDVWAVGTRNGDPVSLHFNGSTWTLFRVPFPRRTTGDLFDVEVSLDGTAWAVGWRIVDDRAKPFVVRWDGTSWRRVAVPRVGTGTSSLHAAETLAADDTWLVGATNGGTGDDVPLALRGTTGSWSQVTLPVTRGFLLDLVMRSPNVGLMVGHGASAGLVMRWNGTEWRRMRLPVVASYLDSVVAFPDGEDWVAGLGDGPVVLRRCPPPS